MSEPMRQIRWGALVTLAQFVAGLALLSYCGFLAYTPLAYGLPGTVLIIDAFLGGRR